MSYPKDRKYAETHEWLLVDGDTVTLGITQYAADELTDITYVDLPEIGARIAPGDVVGEVESVKATSEMFSAVGGEVIAVNESLADHPELVNDDPYDEGWIVRLKADSLAPFENLMDAKEYGAFVKSQR